MLSCVYFVLDVKKLKVFKTLILVINCSIYKKVVKKFSEFVLRYIFALLHKLFHVIKMLPLSPLTRFDTWFSRRLGFRLHLITEEELNHI